MQQLHKKLANLILSGGGANRQPSPKRRRGKAKSRKQNSNRVYEQVSTRGIFNNLSRQPRVLREFKRDGTLLITNEEPFLTVTGNGQEAIFNPGATGMVMLDNTALQYDQYKIRSCSLEYRTGTGTTTSGNMVMGVDYNPQSDLPSDNSYAAVAILEPKFVGPVWTACSSVPLDVSRAMKGNTWRFTNNTGPSGSSFVLRANVNTTGQTFGIIWCRYSVEFCSPKQIQSVAPQNLAPSTRVSGEVVSYSDGTIGDIAIVSVEQVVTNFSPLEDPFGTGNIDTAPNNSVELDVALPSCPSGTISTINVGVPSYAYQAALNAQPLLVVQTPTGSDITALFAVSPLGLTAGPLDPLGQVSGVWAWALTALVPIAQEYIVKIVTKLFDGVVSGINSYFVEATGTQSVVPLPPNMSRSSTVAGLGQAVILVPGGGGNLVVSNGIQGISVSATASGGNIVYTFTVTDPTIDITGRLVCINNVATSATGSTPTTALLTALVNLDKPIVPAGSPATLQLTQQLGGSTFGFTLAAPGSTYVQSVTVTLSGTISDA